METVPAERAEALGKLRRLCLSKLTGYAEGMEYGMPSYSKDGVVEVSFNSQKNYISVYMRSDVLDRYRDQVGDCGKSCIRYRKPEQIDFGLVERMVEETAG